MATESRHAASTGRVQPRLRTPRVRSVKRVIAFMNDQLRDPIPLRSMAEVAHMSPYHFNRVFRETTGIPPCQFLYALRLQEAKRLLLTTDLSVTEICFRVGYNSLGSFITRFKKLVGLPPNQFRNLSETTASYLNLVGSRNAKISPDDGTNSASFEVSGKIRAPQPFEGPVFVGLFPSSIPQSHPVGCALLTTPDSYRIPRIPKGRYHVFAVALPWREDPLDYLLTDGALRGRPGRQPVRVGRYRIRGDTDVSLRSKLVTDPPILSALPFLLAKRLGAL